MTWMFNEDYIFLRERLGWPIKRSANHEDTVLVDNPSWQAVYRVYRELRDRSKTRFTPGLLDLIMEKHFTVDRLSDEARAILVVFATPGDRVLNDLLTDMITNLFVDESK